MQDAWIHHKKLVRLEASAENILNHSRGTAVQMRDIPYHTHQVMFEFSFVKLEAIKT